MLFVDRFAPRPHVVVVGGGITGLAVALRLHDTAPGVSVTVFDQARTVGGKLRTGPVGGLMIEEGAESFLLRAPEATALVERVGLGSALVHPTASGAAVLVDGGLRSLPAGTLLGVPADLEAVAASGVLSPDGLAQVRAEPCRPGQPLTTDTTVGAVVADRLGSEVLDRLVEPLLGGVYAGRADRLSLRATIPALAEALTTHGSVVRAAQAARGDGAARARAATGPVFATVRGGLSSLVTAVAHASGAAIRTGAAVRELRRARDGWELTVGSTRDAGTVRADAVVLAVPAAPAARLLTGVNAAAATAVGALEYASVALVTIVLPGRLPLPPGTGVLVPPSAGRLVKAVTYVSQKWAHVLPDGAGDTVTVLRASVGRFGDETALHLRDEVLGAEVLAELDALLPLGGRRPEPLAVRVSRWGGALPQYAPGHLDRIALARAELATEPTLALAGAAYDGVGIPACVRSGWQAAENVLTALANRPRRDESRSGPSPDGSAQVASVRKGEPVHG